RKIRNTIRFMLANTADFEPQKDGIAETDLEEVDRYMLHRLQNLVTTVRDGYDKYEFLTVYHQIHNFCTSELSSFYLDFAKDVLYIEAHDNSRRRSIQTVYHEILVTLAKLLAPIIPHTAEEVWEYIPGVEAEYVQLTDIPAPRKVANFDNLEDKWNHFMQVRDDVLKALEEARNEKVIGKSLEAKITVVPKDEQTKEVLTNIANIHQLFIVSEAIIVESDANTKAYRYVDVLVENHPGEKCERCRSEERRVGKECKERSRGKRRS